MRRNGEDLVDYIHGLTYTDLSNDVVHQAKNLLLDSLGTMFLGSRWDNAAGLLDFIASMSTIQECTVISSKIRTSCELAAFANSSLSQIHDCNDGHRVSTAFGGSPHPGRVVIPTSLALGEKYSLSGEELITAIVVGYDVGVRIRGMKERPPSDAYCAAAIASKIMKLSKEQTFNSLGIAGFHSPRYFMANKGFDTNFLSNGYSSKIGIEAAMLAKRGLTGPPLGDDKRLSTRFYERGLGKEFEIMNIYVKPYPTCRMTHGAIEAILDIMRESDIKPEKIEEITINQLYHGMGVTREKVGVDSNYKSCQFNLPYIISCALYDGEITEKQFTKVTISDIKYHNFSKKIKVFPDETLDGTYPDKKRPTSVSVKMTSGKTYSKQIDLPRGDPLRPLTDSELSQKFLNWSYPMITQEQGNKIINVIKNLDKLLRVNTFTRILSSSE